jgi:hypothetical protein
VTQKKGFIVQTPGDTPTGDQPQDGRARWVGDVGTDALHPEGGGALIALGSTKICEIYN